MTLEEAIARAAFEECEHFNGTGPASKRWTWDDMPCDELDPRAYWLRKARAILSALKAAGLVIVPEEPTREIVDIAFPPAPKWRSTSLSTQVRDYAVKTYMEDYRAMIRAATSPGAPVPVDPARHG